MKGYTRPAGALWGSPLGLEWGQKGGWRLVMISHHIAHHHHWLIITRGQSHHQTKQSLKFEKKMKLSLPNIYHVCFSLNESLRNHFKIWTKDGQYIYYYMYCSKCLHKFSHIYLFIFNFGPFRNFLMASPAWRGPV